MKQTTIKDMMIPRDQYLILDESSSLIQAMIALAERHKEGCGPVHNTVFVSNSRGEIVSRLTIFDLMRAVEPKYQEVTELNLNHFGFSNEYLESILKTNDLWAKPLEELCSKVPRIKIRDIMLKIPQSEKISISEDLHRAMNRMILNRHHLLLVYDRNNQFTGTLRSIDLFQLILNLVEQCQLKKS
ncbi:MAG: CBS domain-containing protein [Desulfonatronovibrionaceae bacterium]